MWERRDREEGNAYEGGRYGRRECGRKKERKEEKGRSVWEGKRVKMKLCGRKSEVLVENRDGCVGKRDGTGDNLYRRGIGMREGGGEVLGVWERRDEMWERTRKK